MTAMNETIVSSSPSMLPDGQNQSNKKRSISSSLLDFFNRITYNNNNNTHNNENSTGDSFQDEPIQIKKRKKLASFESSPLNNNNNSDSHLPQAKETNSKMEQPLILYETEDTDPHGSTDIVRPPILPILPIQRLRLLRRKQWLKLRNDARLIQGLDTEPFDLKQHQSMSCPEPLQSDQSIVIHRSGTPSPVKNSLHVDELVLDSNTNNIVINKKHNKFVANNNSSKSIIQLKSRCDPARLNHNNFKGTKWSGDFAYDLSEYDTKPKPSETTSPAKNTSSLVKQTDASNNTGDSGNTQSLKIPLSELTDFTENSIKNKKLTKNKLDLLINGPKTQQICKDNELSTEDNTSLKDVKGDNAQEPTSTTAETKNIENEKPSIVLPTVGFDFLKNNDKPPKEITFSFNNQNKNEEKEKNETVPRKPLFSFSNSITSTKNKDNEKNLHTANDSSKLSFPFNTKSNLTNDNKEESSQQELSTPVVSIDITKDINKPTFTFTTNKNTVTESKPLSFSFRSQTNNKTDEKANTTAPKFSFGSINSKNNESTSTDTNKKPTFSFVNKSETTKNDSKDNNREEDDEDERPRKKPTFSFTTSSTSDNKDSSINKINTQSATKPLFSFGLTSNTSAKKNDDAKEENKHEKLSFGLTKSTTEKKPLTFSFGSAPTTADTKPSTSLNVTPSQDNNPSSFKFSTNISNTNKSEEPDSKKRDIFSFDKKSSNEQASPTTAITTTTTGKPSFIFGGKPATGTTTTTQPSFSFNNKQTNTNNESSQKPTFSFGATTSANADKPGDTSLNKPSFSFGTTNKETTSTYTTTLTTPSFSFNKPTGTLGPQLKNEAKSLGVSLTNPLLNKPSNLNITNNNGTSTSMSANSGGFKFTRQQAPPLVTTTNQQNSASGLGTSLFGGNTSVGMNGIQANNTINSSSNLGNNQGFNFTFNANNNSGNNNLMSSFGVNTNNSAPPGGSVFSLNNNNSSGSMFGSNSNINMNSSAFNFGQQQQPQINTFHPSSQVNINFNRNANANPIDIFSGSSNNNGMGNMNNTITPQPSQFTHRKIARMRASRR